MPATFTLPVSIGQVRRRITYDLRVVGLLSPEVAIMEGVDDQRRITVAVSEVAAWPVVAVSA